MEKILNKKKINIIIALCSVIFMAAVILRLEIAGIIGSNQVQKTYSTKIDGLLTGLTSAIIVITLIVLITVIVLRLKRNNNNNNNNNNNKINDTSKLITGDVDCIEASPEKITLKVPPKFQQKEICINNESLKNYKKIRIKYSFDSGDNWEICLKANGKEDYCLASSISKNNSEILADETTEIIEIPQGRII